MVGLPVETAWVLLGFPLFWIAYTVIFMVKTKNWPDDREGGGEG